MRMGMYRDGPSSAKDIGTKTHNSGINETPIFHSLWDCKSFIHSLRNPLHSIYLPGSVMEDLFRAGTSFKAQDKLDKGNKSFHWGHTQGHSVGEKHPWGPSP